MEFPGVALLYISVIGEISWRVSAADDANDCVVECLAFRPVFPSRNTLCHTLAAPYIYIYIRGFGTHCQIILAVKCFRTAPAMGNLDGDTVDSVRGNLISV
jgi:hypothetical protein